jgi:hypothetical protein
MTVFWIKKSAGLLHNNIVRNESTSNKSEIKAASKSSSPRFRSQLMLAQKLKSMLTKPVFAGAKTLRGNNLEKDGDDFIICSFVDDSCSRLRKQ